MKIRTIDLFEVVGECAKGGERRGCELGGDEHAKFLLRGAARSMDFPRREARRQRQRQRTRSARTSRRARDSLRLPTGGSRSSRGQIMLTHCPQTPPPLGCQNSARSLARPPARPPARQPARPPASQPAARGLSASPHPFFHSLADWQRSHTARTLSPR